MTATLPITKKTGIARGNDNVVGLIVDTSLLESTGGGGDYIYGDILEWPEGPISTIHVRLRSIEDLDE